jgi:SAM-dependent methyltransferase
MNSGDLGDEAVIQLKQDAASFKDPVGSVFVGERHIERSCNPLFVKEVLDLISSPLFAKLREKNLVLGAEYNTSSGRFIQEKLPYWIYPYECSFLMLKESALTTLRIQQESIMRGYTLKDASAYNVCFRGGGMPVHVDLYSFERSSDSIIWNGYDQFCREYLNPLLFQFYTSAPFQFMYRGGLNGISSETISKLLPWRTYLSPMVLVHAHIKSCLDARLGRYGRRRNVLGADSGVGSKIILRLVEKLHTYIESLVIQKKESEWSSYKNTHSYSDEQYALKCREVEGFFASRRLPGIIDYGCNTGEFTKLVAGHTEYAIGIDADPVCIDEAFRSVQGSSTLQNLYFAVQDLANPSASSGWNALERKSFSERFKTEGFMALAFVHHLRIVCNIPTAGLLSYFRSHHLSGIIEYVAPCDPMAEHLLQARPGIDISDYYPDAFRAELSKHFIIEKEVAISTSRTLYMLKTM